jgi:hypothetical protein
MSGKRMADRDVCADEKKAGWTLETKHDEGRKGVAWKCNGDVERQEKSWPGCEMT